MMEKRLVAFILAAGFSSRMGKFKPLLPLGDTFVLERAVAMFRNAGIKDIRVVTGYRAFKLEPVLRELGVRGIKNSRFEEGMFSSVQAAVQTLDAAVDAFFILPVDIPLVRSTTVYALIETFHKRDPDVVYPCFLAERGHPPLIAGHLANDILRWSGNGGLKAFLARWETGAVEVAVPDENVLLDMDQEEDYQIMKEKAKAPDIPTAEEGQALLMIYNTEEKILRHGQAVADVAVKLGEALNSAGCRHNLALLKAAGLLHDIAKGQPNHAKKGEEIIRSWGFLTVSDVVGAHTDINLNEDQPIREKEILYLADKLVRGAQVVSLQERFSTAQQRYACDAEISQNVEKRLQDALKIQEHVASILGRSVDKVLEYDERRAQQAM